MKWLFNNWPQKIGSLLLAMLMWQVVIRIEEPQVRTTFDNVGVDYRNRPADLALTRGPATVSVEISSIGGELPKVRLEDITAWVDLSKAEAGESSFRIRLTVPEEIRSKVRINSRPESVTLQLSKVISRNMKLDPPQYTGATERYVLDGQFKLSPDTVTITGPENLVLLARTARITVDVSKLEPGTAYERPVSILDEDGRAVGGLSISPSKVTFSPSLAPRPEEKNVIVSPNWTGVPAAGFRVVRYEITPNQIKVGGNPDQLARLYAVDTDPVNVDGFDQTRDIRVKLRVPTGLKAKESEVRVRVFVERIPIVPGGGG
ncbi:MAG: CdaR family protein [Fimbriimonadales bacterium]